MKGQRGIWVCAEHVEKYVEDDSCPYCRIAELDELLVIVYKIGWADGRDNKGWTDSEARERVAKMKGSGELTSPNESPPPVQSPEE